MIATSKEQGRRLISAGVSTESADMAWFPIDIIKRVNGETSIDKTYELVYKNNRTHINEMSFSRFVPAWSLSALWDIIHRLDKTYEFETKMSSEELIEFLVTLICIRFEHR